MIKFSFKKSHLSWWTYSIDGNAFSWNKKTWYCLINEMRVLEQTKEQNVAKNVQKAVLLCQQLTEIQLCRILMICKLVCVWLYNIALLQYLFGIGYHIC